MLKRTMLIVAAGALVLTACGDDDPLGLQSAHPAALVGKWKEEGKGQGIVLRENGAFEFYVVADGAPRTTEGAGTWDATTTKLHLQIASGYYGWSEGSMINAPSNFNCDYSAAGASLVLTLEVLSVQTIRYERVD